MTSYTRNPQVPKNCGGSYYVPDDIPSEGYQVRRFVMKEKIADMLKYALPLLDNFPRRNRELADTLRHSLIELYRLSVRAERKYKLAETLERMDVELATLKEFVVLASDKDYGGPKYAPPLTLHQRDVWSRYSTEIGKIIGGYLKKVTTQG